jgi:hypothetical protein
MSQFMQRQPPRRAPRANVRGEISAVIRLENGRQITAKLQQLSITGGLMDLAAYLEERTWVDLTIYLSSGAVRTTAEMMFPMRGGVSYRQPFRFTGVGVEELHSIDREVTAVIKQTLKSKSGDPRLRAPRYYLETW